MIAGGFGGAAAGIGMRTTQTAISGDWSHWQENIFNPAQVATNLAFGAAGGAVGYGVRQFFQNKFVKYPLIKQGTSNGETSGKPFSDEIRIKTFEENPKKICVYCRMEGTATQVDHAIPKSLGGNATIDNAQLTCPHCNQSKGNRLFPVNPPKDYFGPWPPSWWKN